MTRTLKADEQTFRQRKPGSVVIGAINVEAQILLRAGQKPEYIAQGILELTIEALKGLRHPGHDTAKEAATTVVAAHRAACAARNGAWFWPANIEDILERVIALALALTENPAGRFCTKPEHERYQRMLDGFIRSLEECV